MHNQLIHDPEITAPIALISIWQHRNDTVRQKKMIHNILERHEMLRLLQPFLRLQEANMVIGELSRVLGIPIEKRDDIVCQTKMHLSYKGYRVDIRDLRWIEESGFAVSIQFKAKQKWHHGIFGDQNRAVLDDLQSMCRSEIDGLSFAPFSTTVPGDPLIGEGSIRLSFLHDSRAFNQDWREGRDISPLLLAPDAHHGNCFIEFQFNPAGYVRQGGKTMLRPDWLQNAFLISEGIEHDAKRMLGME